MEIGIKHCSNKLCLLCQANYLLVKDTIILPVGKLLLTIRHNFTCKSENVLFYMTCTICGKAYVGQTKDLIKRMNNHKSDIRGTPTTEILAIDKHIHFCQLEKYQSFKDPYFHIITVLTVEKDKLCESKEIYYIRKFNPAFNEKTPCGLRKNILECLDTQETRLRNRAKNIEYVRSVKYICHMNCVLTINRSENQLVIQKSEEGS